MKKNSFSISLIVIVLAALLSAVVFGILFHNRQSGESKISSDLQSIQGYDKFDNWSEAYKNFLFHDWNSEWYNVEYKYYDETDGTYKNEITKFFDNKPIAALLYDMNLDGIPELIVYNGSDIIATSTNYVYTFLTGKMKCCGCATVLNSHGGIWHFGNKDYPRLYDENGRLGSWEGIYFYLEDDIIMHELLWDTSDITGLPDNMKKLTKDDDLYNLFYDNYIDDSFEYVEMINVSDVKSMGWNSFVKKYGFQ